MINVSIDLTKVDKKRLKDGKYLNFTVSKRQVQDKYGNDYTAYLYDKDTKVKDYIGSGKEFVWNGDNQPQTNKDWDEPNSGSKDNLPF